MDDGYYMDFTNAHKHMHAHRYTYNQNVQYLCSFYHVCTKYIYIYICVCVCRHLVDDDSSGQQMILSSTNMV